MSGVVKGWDGVNIPLDGVRAGIGLDGVAAAAGAIKVRIMSVLH